MSAARHALAWLVAANAVGLWLSLLLLFPEFQVGEWTYGRWVPVHLNGQLYGWTALPLVGWLLTTYGVRRSWSEAALWAWTAALALGCLAWLMGGSSGKIFLDWKGGSLRAFVAAMVILWAALFSGWRQTAGWWRFAGLVGLALVPVGMMFASDPKTYPPVDRLTGGPTGASLLGSTLFVVGLLLVLPRTLLGTWIKGGWVKKTWWFFGISWVVAIVGETVGGTHFDWWQVGALALLLPWLWLLPKWWGGYEWPEDSVWWRRMMWGWWSLLVASGLVAYFPWVLDHLKFTQGLVAHSHLAMAGFTSAFGMVLLGLLGLKVGGQASILMWNGAVAVMVLSLMSMGWMEGGDWSWMGEPPIWRLAGLAVRSACGAVMLGVSLKWWLESLKEKV